MLLRYWVAIAVAFSEQLCSKHPRGGLKFVFKNTRTTDFDKLSSTIDFLPIGGEVLNYGRSRWIPSGAPFTSTYDRSTYHRTFICTTPGIAIVDILLGAAVVVGKQSRRHPFPPCGLIQWHHDEIIHRVQFVYKVDVMAIYSDLVSRDVTWLEYGVHLAECVTVSHFLIINGDVPNDSFRFTSGSFTYISCQIWPMRRSWGSYLTHRRWCLRTTRYACILLLSQTATNKPLKGFSVTMS